MPAIKKAVCVLAVLAATSTIVIAANTITVNITGSITPAACTPTLSDAGTIDYGNISAKNLNRDEFTYLDEKQLDFSVTCDAPIRLAILASSNRGETAVNTDGTLSEVTGDNLPLFGSTNIAAAGLGLADTQGVGGYGLRLQAGTMQADGISVDSIYARDTPTSWGKDETGSLFAAVISPRYASWAQTGKLDPITFTLLSGKLGVQAYINKTSELDLSKTIRLNGLATLELVYL